MTENSQPARRVIPVAFNEFGGTQASDGFRFTRGKILSALEKEALIEYETRQSGLAPSQIAFNPWSYPPIPIPDPRRMSGRVRLAPKYVTEEFLCHPIS
ncbi:hypothetical protein RE9425_03170 [Prescottella equi]|nr:hypothetical protein RE9425_03170 [Prescottella equi]